MPKHKDADPETKARLDAFLRTIEALEEEHGFSIGCRCEGYGGELEYLDARSEPYVRYDMHGRALKD